MKPALSHLEPERLELAKSLLRQHSVASTVALLNSTTSDQKVTYAQVDSLRRGMVKNRDILPRVIDRRAEPGRFHVTPKPAIDDSDACRRERVQQRDASDNLLRAHLRAGQHLLTLANAVAVGATLGMPPETIRAAAGDPTVAKLVRVG